MVIKTLDDIFGCWKSIPEMADDVGESAWTVQKWNQRKRIPDRAWPSVISCIRKQGKAIDADVLLAIHSNPKRRVSSSRVNAH